MEGVSPDEIAILYRVNGQARFLEEFLREREVRYEVVGGTEFFDRREVKDVIAYFKVIANPKDETSLRRIVNVPPPGHRRRDDGTAHQLGVGQRDPALEGDGTGEGTSTRSPPEPRKRSANSSR